MMMPIRVEETYKIMQVVHDKYYFAIKKVVFNDPATIVFWNDGTKTVIKAKNEPFDPEKGLAMAFAKKALGNKGNYYNTFKKHLPEPEKVIFCADGQVVKEEIVSDNNYESD